MSVIYLIIIRKFWDIQSIEDQSGASWLDLYSFVPRLSWPEDEARSTWGQMVAETCCKLKVLAMVQACMGT